MAKIVALLRGLPRILLPFVPIALLALFTALLAERAFAQRDSAAPRILS